MTEDQRGELRDANPDIEAIEGPEPSGPRPGEWSGLPGKTVELSLTWPDAYHHLATSGSEATQDAPEVSGFATATLAEGYEEDVAVDVIGIQIDMPDLGPDRTVYVVNPLTLDAGNPGAVFAWSTRRDCASAVLDGGLVEVQVNVRGCRPLRTKCRRVFRYLSAGIGPDVVLCEGESVDLDAQVAG